MEKIKIEKNDYPDSYYGLRGTSLVKNAEGEIKKRFNPILIDNSIFSCNTKNINERLNVASIDKLNEKVISLDNIYNNPYAVRNLISELPHQLNRQNSDSDYPGYTAGLEMRMPELYTVLKKIIVTTFKYFNIKLKDLNIEFPFKTGLYNSRNIIYENTPIFIHKDSKKGFAGVIYLNLPEECDGGTAIYEEVSTHEFNKLYEFKMVFNKLILYPSHCYHGLTFNDINTSFRDNYRITQRFFINFE